MAHCSFSQFLHLFYFDLNISKIEPFLNNGRMSGKNTRRPAWMNKDILKHKTETCRGWKQGQTAWKEYWEIVQADRDHISKARALSELKLNRYVKVGKKIFYTSTSDERKNRKNVCLFQKEIGSLISGDVVKAQVLN